MIRRIGGDIVTFAQQAVDPVFAAFGEDATWIGNGGGAPVAIKVIRQVPEDLTSFGAARILSDAMVVSVRVSEVSAPTVGDAIQIGAVSYAVQAEPRLDRWRVRWRLDLVVSI